MKRTHVLVIVGILGFVAFCLAIRLNGWHERVLHYKFRHENIPLWEQRNVSVEKPRDEIFLIPRDDEFVRLGSDNLEAVYWRYVNTIQVLCRNQGRFGSFKDGGKEICLDYDFRPNKPCLVYSFGSAFKFDFEVAIIEAFGCEVHTFDPSMDMDKPAKSIPKSITFHPVGIGAHNHVTLRGNWKIKTLDTIIAELGQTNRTVDILKIDVEGAEWESLRQMFKAGTLRFVKQLAIELHYSNKQEQLEVLRGLYDYGFRIFMREHNPCCEKPIKSEFHRQYTPVNELSFINMRYWK